MRLAAAAALFAAALLCCGWLAFSPSARGTGVEAGVSSVVSLSLEQVSPSRLTATVTTTVPGTGLTVGRAGGGAPLHHTDFRNPVTARRVAIAVDPSDRGTLVVTAGPETP